MSQYSSVVQPSVCKKCGQLYRMVVPDGYCDECLKKCMNFRKDVHRSYKE